MKFVLDTHSLIWYLEKNPKLGLQKVSLIEDSNNQILVSMVSLWEISIKSGLGKLNLPLGLSISQLEQHLLGLDFQILGILSKHLDELQMLPLHYRDPFDRLLIAQTKNEQATLMTDDTAIQQYTEIQFV